MITQPFAPKYGSTQTLTPGAASAQVTIDRDKQSRQVCIWNSGANVAFVRIGSSLNGALTASATDHFIPPSAIPTIITKDPQHDMLAHISATGTTLLVNLGEGF